MGKGQHLSTYQRGIVKRYYNHKETLVLTKLQEAVSELYLSSADPAGVKAADRKWTSIAKGLADLGVEEGAIRRIVGPRDLSALARAIGELMSGKK